MGSLDEVKSYMEFWGWKNGGNLGSVKMEDGRVVATHGDATWIADVPRRRHMDRGRTTETPHGSRT